MAIEGLKVKVHESLELASVDISYHQCQSVELPVYLVFAQEPDQTEWSCVAFRNHPSPLCKQCGNPLQLDMTHSNLMAGAADHLLKADQVGILSKADILSAQILAKFVYHRTQV